jgi:hypothetical protein
MDDFDMGLLGDAEFRVAVLRQKLLGIAPVFIYRIPKEKSFGVEYQYVLILFEHCFLGTSLLKTQPAPVKLNNLSKRF